MDATRSVDRFSRPGRLVPTERETLVGVAERSILHGLQYGMAWQVDLGDCGAALRECRASFVTLRREEGQLRGCMGTVDPMRPLVIDVASNAFDAAFTDYRFGTLTWPEFPALELRISVLGDLTPLEFEDEDDLLRKIQPGVDGLELRYRGARSVLLPSVWQELPDTGEFVQHLKMKAGLAPGFWSGYIQVARFTAECFGRHVRSLAEVSAEVGL